MLKNNGEWVKSSRSGPAGHCVEVAMNPAIEDVLFVRNSNNRSGPVVSFTADEWRAFLAGARDGEFDLP